MLFGIIYRYYITPNGIVKKKIMLYCELNLT